MRLGLNDQIKIASISFALAVGSVLFTTYISYQQEIETLTNRLYTQTTIEYDQSLHVFKELEYTLNALDTFPDNGCTEQTIKQLRAIVIKSNYLKSAAINIDNNLFCTDLGLMDASLREPNFQTKLGWQVWLNITGVSNENSKGLLLSKGQGLLGTLDDYFINNKAEEFNTTIISTARKHIIVQQPTINSITPEIIDKLAVVSSTLHTPHYIYESKTNTALNFTVISSIKSSTYLEFLLVKFIPRIPIGLLLGLITWYALFKYKKSLNTPEKKLADAIENKNIAVHYQPVISLKNGLCVGAEALVRLQKANGELIPPKDFISIAENSGLIGTLTDLTLDCIFKELNQQLKNGQFYVSVNVSAFDISDDRFLKALDSRLKKYAIPASQIAIEITESAFIKAENFNYFISSVHKNGHQIFIDDFGTGYSSLSYLHNLRINSIKIDKIFVDAIGTDSATSIVVKHIIDMAKELNLKIIAEGVESDFQVTYLEEHGVDAVQGWVFAKAMPVKELLLYINEKNKAK